MGLFHFRLDAVLRLRQATQTARAADLTVARSGADDAEQALEARRESRDQDLSRLRGEGQKVDLDTWAAGRAHYAGLRHAEAAARQDLSAAQSRLDDARFAYLRAHGDVVALDRLRDRRQQAWAAAKARTDQAELDEAGARQGRRETTGG